MTMKLPPLKPRANSSAAAVAMDTLAVPTRHDWESNYSEIERLYVRERRRLRYVMQYMEREHGLRATEQMYKKRFARWGFSKNTKRSKSTSPGEKCECGSVLKNRPEQAPVPRGVWVECDELIHRLLIRVRTWAVAFFDSRQRHGIPVAINDNRLPWDNPPKADDAKAISSSFKLTIDLLQRGHGKLAGRVARKAFLLVEGLMDLEVPALLWNVLELLYHILVLGHARLFQLLLSHLWALVRDKKPSSHPAYGLLRDLQKLIAQSPNQNPIHDRSGRAKPLNEPQLDSKALSSTLERAWAVNAEILFQRFGPHHLDVYCCVNWDDCAIRPPAEIIKAAKPWIDSKQGDTTLPWKVIGVDVGDGLSMSTYINQTFAEDGMLSETPPFDDRKLYERSIMLMRKRGAAIVEHHDSDNLMLLRILAGLVTADVIEPYLQYLDSLSTAEEVLGLVPRVSAGAAACTIRLMIDLDDEPSSESYRPRKAVEQLRRLISLRTWAHGGTHPKVIQEMLLLEDALIAAGDAEEAQVAREHLLLRLEAYVREIPADSV